MDEDGIKNVEYLYLPYENDYVNVAYQLRDSSLDFVLVDGNNCRDRCALSVVRKIKTGGLLVIDNANWYLPSSSISPNSRTYEMGPVSKEWEDFLDATSHWQLIWTTNGVTDTVFFIKKENPFKRTSRGPRCCRPFRRKRTFFGSIWKIPIRCIGARCTKSRCT